MEYMTGITTSTDVTKSAGSLRFWEKSQDDPKADGIQYQVWVGLWQPLTKNGDEWVCSRFGLDRDLTEKVYRTKVALVSISVCYNAI